MDDFFGFVAFLLVAAGLLLWLAVSSFRRAPAEKGLKPIWQQRCSVGSQGFGIRAGTNIPLIRVAIYPEFIVIGGFSTTVIPYKNIAEVSLNKGFFSLGGVHLKLNGLKSYYVLHPRDPKTFVSLLESHLTHRSKGRAFGAPLS